MTMSDPIADMLTRIRNANTAKHDTVDVPASKMKVAIADILVDEGFITKYDIVDNGNFKDIRVTLKYGANKNEAAVSVFFGDFGAPGVYAAVVVSSGNTHIAMLIKAVLAQSDILIIRLRFHRIGMITRLEIQREVNLWRGITQRGIETIRIGVNCIPATPFVILYILSAKIGPPTL